MAGTKGKLLALWVAGTIAVVLGISAWSSWPALRFWWLFEPVGRNAQGYPEYRHRRTGIVMVRLPGARFWMGAQKSDPTGANYDPEAQDDEGPVHEVTLGPFLIGKHEVTQAQWLRVMGDNPSQFRGDDLPVENVSWDRCREFCARTGLGLPTEAQWEYASRAGAPGPGAAPGPLADIAWLSENSGGRPHPVGQKAPNGFGLHDMLGNVWEWCQTRYQPGYGPTEGGAGDDSEGTARWVFRGGTFRHLERAVRFARRSWNYPDDSRDLGIGLRVVAPAPGSGP